MPRFIYGFFEQSRHGSAFTTSDRRGRAGAGVQAPTSRSTGFPPPSRPWPNVA